MNQLTCLRVVEWIQARNAGLPAAAAIRLEEHLAQCASCSAQARTLDRLQELSDSGAEPLEPAARQRAVLRAFAAAKQPPQPMAARSTWLVPSTAGALAAVALVAFGFALRPAVVSPVANASRVIAGELDLAGRAIVLGGLVPAGATLQTQRGAVVALAHAKVELRARTRARWDETTRVLHLEEGSVISEVDPERRASFSVQTQNFRAVVLGTRFEVSPAGVSVTRGRVQVTDLDGRERARLGAGQSFTWTKRVEPATAVQPTTASALQPAAASAASAEAQPVAPRPQPSAADALLDQARVALGRRELERARKLVAQALTAAVQPSQRAEALTLRAECALVAGDLAGAAKGYYDVARRFAGSTAGENALFAAARLDADRLEGAQARRGLTRYLARHPRGRFVKEANARLRELRGVAGAQP